MKAHDTSNIIEYENDMPYFTKCEQPLFHTKFLNDYFKRSSYITVHKLKMNLKYLILKYVRCYMIIDE